MIVRNSNNKQSFVKLFEKWWHYPLLGLTWFLPHKAYLLKDIDYSKSTKSKFSIWLGLATGVSFILGDIIRSMGIASIPTEYKWISKFLAYPVSILFVFIIYKWYFNLLKKRDRLEFKKS